MILGYSSGEDGGVNHLFEGIGGVTDDLGMTDCGFQRICHR
jgi:hypothetical protein